MSSSYDSGKSADIASIVRESKCPKSPDGKHDWNHYFKNSPSAWGECQYCNVAYFNK